MGETATGRLTKGGFAIHVYCASSRAVHDQEPGQATGLRGEPGLRGGHQNPRLLPGDRLGPAGAEKSETAL